MSKPDMSFFMSSCCYQFFTQTKNLTLRQDQVNLLVYGSDRIYFKQKQKNNITKF